MNDDQVMNFYLIFGLFFLLAAMGMLLGTGFYFAIFFIIGTISFCFGLRIIKVPTVLDIRKYIIEIQRENARSRAGNVKAKPAEKTDDDCEEEIIDE